MAHTTSTTLGSGKPVVAIAGGTGDLGQTVARVFLDEAFRPSFSRVLVLTRNTTSPSARALAGLGAELHQTTWSSDDEEDAKKLRETLRGVDVVVNVLGGSTGAQEMNALLEAAVDAGVRVYFPSEYGSDLRANDFPGFDHKLFVEKRDHLKYAEELSKGKMKVIAVATGAFVEVNVGLLVGFDVEKSTFTTFGPGTAKVAFTSKPDIGRALARLTILSTASSSSAADEVPTHVRVAGSLYSVADIRAAYERVTGKETELVTKDLQAEKERVKKGYLDGSIASPIDHIWLLMAEGKLDFSTDNYNEVVNPKEHFWKWKTVEDHLQENFGK